MKIFTTRREASFYIKEERFHRRSIGLVPTMGALHEGHLSLIREARKQTEIPVVSIFVNPAQFGPSEDFDKYPRQQERDLQLCAAEGVRAVYMPSAEEMYPEGFCTYVEVEGLSERLCGQSRPGFFRGVTTVVNMLFHILRPHMAFFGLKDRQQFLILKRMVDNMSWDVEMVGLPTVREDDGLALSSRNKYLTSEQRQVAPLLYQSMLEAREVFEKGCSDPAELRRIVVQKIESEPQFKIDYVEVVDPLTLQTPGQASSRDFIALAAFLGQARLIDNLQLGQNT